MEALEAAEVGKPTRSLPDTPRCLLTSGDESTAVHGHLPSGSKCQRLTYNARNLFRLSTEAEYVCQISNPCLQPLNSSHFKHKWLQARKRHKHQVVFFAEELERMSGLLGKVQASQKALARQMGQARGELASEVEVIVERALGDARSSQGAHIDRAVREAVAESSSQQVAEAGETAELKRQLEEASFPCCLNKIVAPPLFCNCRPVCWSRWRRLLLNIYRSLL